MNDRVKIRRRMSPIGLPFWGAFCPCCGRPLGTRLNWPAAMRSAHLHIDVAHR